MARANKVEYECSSCGSVQLKWHGRCPDCGEWNTLSERAVAAPTLERHARRVGKTTAPIRAIPLAEVDLTDAARQPIGLSELDRVLGGGVVPGSLVLVGGDPGIGKSTLMLQTLELLAQQGQTTLYISGEESAAQTRLRGERLGVGHPQLLLLAETDLTKVLAEADRAQPTTLVLDSIQTLFAPELDSAPGSMAQLREVTARILMWAKRQGVACFLIGHVTKDGQVAGPRMLEHMVDTVLYFEGEAGGLHRLLRARKNRFGSTDEIGLFAMTGRGLEPISNPSEIFLSKRPEDAAGSAVIPALQGSRPILLEVQALVHGGMPSGRRTALGLDRNRINLLTAVLERRVGLAFADHDLYLSVVGGARLNEPAADLALAAAMVSSFRNVPIPQNTVCFGEIGLAGELRPVHATENRLKEAAKLGFDRAVIPCGSEKLNIKGMHITPCKSLSDALDALFD
jgi:DNA repair protein RadA/Sms